MFEYQDPLKAPLRPWDRISRNLKKLGDYKLMVGIPTKLLVLDLIPWSYLQNVTSSVPRRIPLTYYICSVTLPVALMLKGQAEHYSCYKGQQS